MKQDLLKGISKPKRAILERGIEKLAALRAAVNDAPEVLNEIASDRFTAQERHEFREAATRILLFDLALDLERLRPRLSALCSETARLVVKNKKPFRGTCAFNPEGMPVIKSNLPRLNK